MESWDFVLSAKGWDAAAGRLHVPGHSAGMRVSDGSVLCPGLEGKQLQSRHRRQPSAAMEQQGMTP